MTEIKQTYQQLEQELEVWRHGPSCWSCGDSGDVHQLDGEWLGKCNCLAAQLIDVTAERDQLKAKLAELESIGELINSQDNRCTDQPMFAVMEKRGILTLDTHDHDRIEWVETESGDYCEADETKARRLEALHQGHRDTPGWERYAIKDVDVFVTACFTEQGCKDFLARDGHNHRRPFIYAFGSYRNGEYQAVRNWLKSLPKKTGD
jgi:hypothetical protein